jgi:heme-degrading monooxygenase HmoA
MIARVWKAKCPKKFEEGFISYLYETGIKDTSETEGSLGAQIFSRDIDGESEITLLTYWDDFDCIKAFAGEDISTAKLYPEDSKYELKPDLYVNHYTARENCWL